MYLVLRILLPLLGTAVAYTLLVLFKMLISNSSSPLRKLPGPKNPSLVFGNFKQMEDDPRVTRTWRKKFGPTFKFRGACNTLTFYTADTRAINHILKTTGIYHKGGTRLNPAFGMAQIRNLTGLFLDKSVQLRDVWARQVTMNEGPARIDVLSALSKITLDIIGQAGFNYQFDSLNPNTKPNDVQEVVHNMFHSATASREGMLRILVPMLPSVWFLPVPGRKVFEDARQRLARFGNMMLADAKTSINAAGGQNSVGSGRDLFSILLRANLSDANRMSDAELAGQIAVFLAAGHATTSSAISWTLHALSINKSVQTKLRAELLAVGTDNPSLDELNSLVYLDWVVKETLRVYPPVSFVTRMAVTDDVLPLVTPCVDSEGTSHNSLRIPKGLNIRIPIADVNTDPNLWGTNADEYRPERWEKVPEAVNGIPGVWANLLTFLAGPHNCIGFRFSIADAVPVEEVGQTSSVLQTSFVVSEREKGSQMPLIVKPYQA
ncbi:cytochrome P450 [Mycena epipterygia]|nr:cytochrome P450 [Mycena epipterygia]